MAFPSNGQLCEEGTDWHEDGQEVHAVEAELDKSDENAN